MKYFAALLFVSISSIAGAQYNFLAYRVKGTVTYSDHKKQYTLKVGKILDKSKSVNIGKNASLTLICEKSSQALVLNAGTYELDKLAASCNTPTASITANYFNYVWWQFTHPKASAEEERNKNVGGPGAVSRGCPGIEFISTDTVGFFRENLVLRWKITAPTVSKEFVLYAFQNSPVPLIRIPMTKNHISIDSLDMKLESSTEYFWTVRMDGKELCQRKLLQVWSREDFDQLLDSIDRSLTVDLDNAEKDYMLGYLMEKNNIMGEAYRYYKQAAASSPGNPRYKTTLKRFRQLFRVA